MFRILDYSPPFSALGNEWIYSTAPPMCLHGVGGDLPLFVFHFSKNPE